jgi:malate permease and related proteins
MASIAIGPQHEIQTMFSQIATITLPIFVLALVGFFYSRRVKPDLAGANKLIVDIALPVLGPPWR